MKSKHLVQLSTILLSFFLFSSCSDETEETLEAVSADVYDRFNRVINVFENDSPNLNYDACTDIGDGRGYTCGWIGLVTSEVEMVDLVRAYDAKKGNNSLSEFKTELEKLAKLGSGATSGLTNFTLAWQSESTSPEFHAVYDSIVKTMYYDPAMSYLAELGYSKNLTRFIVYDAVIQHGDGEDADGLQAMINRTNAKNPPNEEAWCSTFLNVRYEVLSNPANKETAEVWGESRSRIDIQRDLIEIGNWDFAGPIEINNDVYTHCIIR